MVLRNSIIAFCAIALISCGEQSPELESGATVSLGEELYNNNCAVCHGLDGKLGAGGASDLSSTIMNKEEMEDVVENGQGGMPPQGHIFTNKEEIGEVVDFVLTLK